MSPEDQQVIREENDKLKEENAKIAEDVATRWSLIKRDFLGAPIALGLQKLKEGKIDESVHCGIPFRQRNGVTEKYWVRGQDDKLTVIYTVHYTDEIDQSLAKTMLYEIQESKKIVKQAASISYHKDCSKLPPGQLSELGINPDQANCGLIAFTLYQNHIKEGIDGPLYFLQSFRQFLSYHIHFIKTMLHSKMRRRVNKLQIVFEKAQRQGMIAKNFKTTIGGSEHSSKADQDNVSIMK